MEGLQEKKEIREWIFLFLGSAIGSGILLLPLKAGEVSLWTTYVAIIISLGGTFVGQKMMIVMTMTTPDCLSYDSAIDYHLGKRAGFFLSIFFLILVFTIVVILGLGSTTNIAAMLQSYHIVSGNIETNPIYVGIALLIISIPLLLSEKILLIINEKIVVVKIIVLLILVVMFIPLWNPSYITHYMRFSIKSLPMGVLELLPILIFGATFFSAIGSMSRYFQTRYSEETESNFKRANKSNLLSILALFLVLILFITSALFALSPSSLNYATSHNLTALAVIGLSAKGSLVARFSIFSGFIIALLAMVTSLYANILGVIDGIWMRLSGKGINRKYVTIGILVVLYFCIILNLNIISFITHVISPLMVVFIFFVPVVAIYKSNSLKKHRGIYPMVSAVVGILLLVASIVN
ncbi:MAG: hypothetical protein NTX05_05490 [Fusobacteria bacterium]|nr:hypothetical protein [Fusobacteriota bacterium]